MGSGRGGEDARRGGDLAGTAAARSPCCSHWLLALPPLSGALPPVSAAPWLDFTAPKTIGRDIRSGTVAPGGGYDNAWVLSDWNATAPTSRVVASLASPVTRIRLTLATDQPSVQFYSGNGLDGSIPRKADQAREGGEKEGRGAGHWSFFHAHHRRTAGLRAWAGLLRALGHGRPGGAGGEGRWTMGGKGLEADSLQGVHGAGGTMMPMVERGALAGGAADRDSKG